MGGDRWSFARGRRSDFRGDVIGDSFFVFFELVSFGRVGSYDCEDDMYLDLGG